MVIIVLMDDDCLDAMDHLHEYPDAEITDGETPTMPEHRLSHCKNTSRNQ